MCDCFLFFSFLFSFLTYSKILNGVSVSQKWTTIFNTDDNNLCYLSSKSVDTEDWSNDAENSALHHRNKLQYIKYTTKVILNANNYTILLVLLYI